ncbi:uncharacterized protein LOC105914750 [Setaria italica]|uniref:uncharacterized protein LOC105914750 n=1 Tax=Setaria italica TaxID=4555 RepID=UPI0006489BAF|nr:uncharacterized protein LOC105914750 [Setaria italica]
MAGLNLNASSEWPNMNDYEGILRSGDRVGGGGSSRVGPPAGDGSGSGVHALLVQLHCAQNEPSRAKWTKEDTQLFCELYCQQIELGNCKSGNMSKWGWKDVQEKFQAATGKFRNSEQFGYKYRQLKLLWQFIQHLRTQCIGLGRREDGSMVASDNWWRNNSRGHADWYDLKDGWPEYIDELDRMFCGVAVTGETSFVPGVSRQINFISSGEEDAADDDCGTPRSCGTPISSGSKRSSSSFRSIATSPSKKNKGPVVRNMNNNMTKFNSSYDHRTSIIQRALEGKMKEVEVVIDKKQHREEARKQDQKLVTDSATELGVHLMEGQLWDGVIMICMDDDLRNIYLCTPVEARLPMIKKYAAMDVPAHFGAQAEEVEDQEEEEKLLAEWWDLFWELVVCTVPIEKYYLVDSGYANRTGFLAPYRQTKYHIQDFQNVPEPQGMKEVFNYAHSSLRNVIERAYGVLKMKWRILLDIPAYPPETQTRIICACMALHNFIRINGDFDSHFGIVDSNMNYVPVEGTQDQPETVPAPESADMASMNAFRDMLAEHLFARS